MKNLKEVLVPFSLLWKRKIYILWIIGILFFGLINLWGYFFMGDIDSFMKEFDTGIIYTFSISVCAPFLISLFFEWLDNKSKKEIGSFIKYKVISIIIIFMFLFICTFLWIGNYKDSKIIQIIILAITLAFSTYIFCISKMNDYDCFQKFDDEDYMEKENKSMYVLNESANTINSNDILDWRKNNE